MKTSSSDGFQENAAISCSQFDVDHLRVLFEVMSGSRVYQVRAMEFDRLSTPQIFRHLR